MENAYANRANHDFLHRVLGRRNSGLNPAVSVLFSDDASSVVEGVLQPNGIFDGDIQTRGGVFYVEPAER